jgi:eukaryotic-like serine/threonine-protein kinase
MMGRLFRISFLLVIFVGIAGVSTYLTLAVFLKTSDNVIVPNLTGKHAVSALELLTELSLNTKVSRSEYNTVVPRHHVILQEPEAGTELKKGRDVRLVLSKGALTLYTPSLRGLSIQQARIVLEENGLCSGEVAITYSDQYKNDVVITQSPGAGTQIERDRCVNLLVSNGMRPRDFAMPDLTDMPFEDALLLMDHCRWRMGTITTRETAMVRPNAVLSQEPAPGHRVEENDSINLVINRAAGENGIKLPTAAKLKLFRYRLENGFLNSHIKLQLNTFGASFDLYDTFMKPGEEIWLFIPDANNTSAFLFRDDEPVVTKDF